MQENKQEKSPIKRKILTFLSEMGISQYDFYRKTGITRGILSQNNGISEENIARFLAVYPQVSAEWLLTGRGNMLREEDGQLAQPTIAAQFPLRTDRQVEMQSIPLYELDASAGLVALFNETARASSGQSLADSGSSSVRRCDLCPWGFDVPAIEERRHRLI